jgi:hypothetical protein
MDSRDLMERMERWKRRGRGGESTKGDGIASNDLEDVERGLENVGELKKRWMR